MKAAKTLAILLLGATLLAASAPKEVPTLPVRAVLDFPWNYDEPTAEIQVSEATPELTPCEQEYLRLRIELALRQAMNELRPGYVVTP